MDNNNEGLPNLSRRHPSWTAVVFPVSSESEYISLRGKDDFQEILLWFFPLFFCFLFCIYEHFTFLILFIFFIRFLFHFSLLVYYLSLSLSPCVWLWVRGHQKERGLASFITLCVRKGINVEEIGVVSFGSCGLSSLPS